MTTHEFKYKQAIVVRSDLKMTPAKLAVQVAHASVGAFKKLRDKEQELIDDGFPLIMPSDNWFAEGFRKVVLKVKSDKEILELEREFVERGAPYFTVYDFGLTELEENTLTCIGIGPDTNKAIDQITGRLGLYR